MKLSLLTFLSTLFITNLFSQMNNIQLSQKITTEIKSISGFDKIDVSEDFEVYIRFSDNDEKVEIEANENLHALIQVEKQGTSLKISTKSYSTGGGLKNKNTVEERLVAYITVKNLIEIKGEEDVVFNLENKLTTDKLSILLNEDCTLNGHLEVRNLVVDLDEDSELNIQGSAQAMRIKANEDSSVKGFDFIVDDLKAHLIEDSEVKLTVNGEIDLRAKEDSFFHYKGEGRFIHKRLRGDSEVKAY